jgi:hypothetical protein
MLALRQHGLGVRGSFRPALGRSKGLRLRRRRHAVPLLQRIQRTAAASRGGFQPDESGRRLSRYRSTHAACQSDAAAESIAEPAYAFSMCGRALMSRRSMSASFA